MRAYLYRGSELYRVEDGVHPDYDTWNIAHRKPLGLPKFFDPLDGDVIETFRRVPGTDDHFRSVNHQTLPFWVSYEEQKATEESERCKHAQFERMRGTANPHGS